jgi:hypothetical protein
MRKTFLGIVILLILTPLITADYVNVPASAFTGKDSSVPYTRPTYGECVYITSGGSGYLTAPVILPDGVIIKYVRLNFIDNTDSGFILVHLVRLNHFNGISANVFSVTTENSASSPSMQWVVDNTASPTSAYRKVRNGQVTWNISAYLSSSSPDLRIYSVQIEYMY